VDVGDRRKAARSVARVPARLASSRVRLEGRTRDLSETGALISADASELPLGKQVELELQHPESGERLTVRGRVARHVETEGTVAAVGLQFEEPDERKSELRNFVAEVKRAESERARSGIAGSIEELGMPNLIQMLGRSSPSGTLSATSGTEEAVLAFEAGDLRYVRLGATRGLKALGRILQWEAGTFEFHAHVDPLDVEDEPMRLEAALLEATRRLDEATRTGAPRLEPKTRFRIDRDLLSAAAGLEKLEEAVLDLAAAGFTVRRILDVIPVDDVQVSEALVALIERGVLVPSS
jgi:Tfp pilus assembly protein PilZ